MVLHNSSYGVESSFEFTTQTSFKRVKSDENVLILVLPSGAITLRHEITCFQTLVRCFTGNVGQYKDNVKYENVLPKKPMEGVTYVKLESGILGDKVHTQTGHMVTSTVNSLYDAYP